MKKWKIPKNKILQMKFMMLPRKTAAVMIRKITVVLMCIFKRQLMISVLDAVCSY